MALVNWLRALRNQLHGRRRCMPIRKTMERKRLQIEELEPRVMLTSRTIQVGSFTDDLNVNNLGQVLSTSQPYSLREALIEAHRATEDTVILELQPGAYNIQRPTNTFLPAGWYLQSDGNPDLDPNYGDFDIRRNLVINGHGASVRGEDLGRVFQISGDIEVTINDLNILNGGGVSQGAGLFVSRGADVTLNNVNVFQNETTFSSSSQGGGLFADNAGGTITINGGRFETNVAQGSSGSTARGGAIYLANGQLNIVGTSFRLNDADGGNGNPGSNGGSALGGALYVAQGGVFLYGATFERNWATGGNGGGQADQGGQGGIASGGAIYVESSSTFGILNSTFIDNRAWGGRGGDGDEDGGDGGYTSGGAIRLGLGSVNMTIDGTRFQDNAAYAAAGGQGNRSGGDGGRAEGGAIAANPILSFLTSQHRLTLRSDQFQNNLARGGTGGFARDGDAGPGGDARGGAIAVDAPQSGAATLTIENTPFVQNRALAGDGGNVRNGPAGRGGNAQGGAIATIGPVMTTITGTMSLTGTATNPTAVTSLGAMIGNAALGGNGGEKTYDPSRPWSDRDAAGDGGGASGGALAAQDGGWLVIKQITFSANSALAGNGGDGDGDGYSDAVGTRGGNSGNAQGGALATTIPTTLEEVTFIKNVAAGGRLDAVAGSQYGELGDASPLAGGKGGRDHNGAGLDGGRGGTAEGGAVYGQSNNLTIRDGGFLNNQALGGVGGPGGAGASETDSQHQGGSGGNGGDASGGAIRISQVPTLVLENTLVAGNAALAGRGGSGGRGGDNPRLDGVGGLGGVGGNGGSARGGGLSVSYGSGPNLPANSTTVTDSYVRDNMAIAGDGGFAGNGGGGLPYGGLAGRVLRVVVGQIFILGHWEDVYEDVRVSGGNGGNAFGGGMYLDGVNATVERSTVEQNLVSSGWGAAGGYGGPGGDVGGDGGAGGAGGDAAGGGIALYRGSLALRHSTVFANSVYAGSGGNGGFGGVGIREEGGNGGNGGRSGYALGGGISIDDSVPAAGFTTLAVTVAGNNLHAGAVGFGGAPGKSPHGLYPIRYDVAPGQTITFGALSVVSADNLKLLQNSASGAVSPMGTSSASAFAIDPSGAIALAGGTLFVGGSIGATVGVALIVAASSVEFAETGAFALYFGSEYAASVALTGAASAFGSVCTIAAGAGLFLMVGGTVLTKFLIGGITTGDWEGAMYDALGSPGKIYPYQFSVLLTGVRPPEDEEDPIPASPGVPGQDGAEGAVEGINLWGHGSLSRTLVSGGAATAREWTRQSTTTRDSSGELIGVYLLSERTADLRNPTDVNDDLPPMNDYDGSFVTDGTNLIGVLNGSGISDRHGSTATPLDPKLDFQTRLNGGATPTLKLLSGSPARNAVAITGSDTSQNGYVWSGTADIGAWGGALNRAPVTVPDARVVPQNGSVSLFLRDLLRNDSDPDGDPIRIIGGASAFTAQHGTIAISPFAGDYNSPNALLIYTPDTDYLGPDTVTYQVSDGLLSVLSKINLSVLPAEFTGLSDHTIVFGTEQLNLAGTIVAGGNPVRSFSDYVNISFGDFSAGFITVDAFGHFLVPFFPGTNLAPSTEPYTVTYEYYDQGELVAVGTSQITVTQAPLKRLSWQTPADITYGTPLSATQLNAMAVVGNAGGSGEHELEGTYRYTPSPGLVLPVGDGQVLNVVFTPDAPEYLVTTAQVALNVKKATPVLSVAGRTVAFDGQAHAASFSLTGALGESLNRFLTITYTDQTGNVTTDPPVDQDTYRVSVSFAGNANYNPVNDNSQFIVIRNASPAAAPGGASTNEDTPVEIDLRALVTAPTTPVELLVFQVGSAEFGTVELLADGHTARFRPAANYNGTGAQFSYTVTAPANAFGPAATTEPGPVLVGVVAVNDAPVNALPSTRTVDEDKVLKIRGVSVSDVDLAEGNSTMKVTLSVDHGTLSLAQTAGLTFEAGDGTDDPTVTFSGSKAAIDAVFAELVYKPLANFNGTDHLHLLSSDLGNFGTGGALTDSEALTIVVNAVNDAPTLTVPAGQTALEDVDKAISGITVADPDGGSLTVTLAVSHGTLTLGTTTGLTVKGNRSGVVTLSGSIANLNAALASLLYCSRLNCSGADTLSITASDGSLSTKGSVTLTVKSAAKQATDLKTLVIALKTAQVLSRKQAEKLLDGLDLKGKKDDLHKVQSFLKAIAKLLHKGVLTQAQAGALSGPGNLLLLSVARK